MKYQRLKCPLPYLPEKLRVVGCSSHARLCLFVSHRYVQPNQDRKLHANARNATGAGCKSINADGANTRTHATNALGADGLTTEKRQPSSHELFGTTKRIWRGGRWTLNKPTDDFPPSSASTC